MTKIKYLIITILLQFSGIETAEPSTNLEELFIEVNSNFLEFFKKEAPKDVVIKLYANWEINYPAASTERSTDFAISKDKRPVEWSVSILSGYIQEEFGGLDTHLLALCHEMAHHLGGKPYKTDDNGKIRWASMEPQADYWATKVCLPLFLKKHPKYLRFREEIHPEILRRCAIELPVNENKYLYCLFSAQAAFQMAKIHQKYKLPMEPDEDPVDPVLPDTAQVRRLDRNVYPSNQCRFDTCFNGALQIKRPACWYPKN